MTSKAKHSRTQPEEDLRAADVIDIPDALHRLGNDEELFRDIARIYLEDAPEILRTVRTALAEADARRLQRAAHSLKGLAATLSAGEAISAAFRLEQMGATGNLTEAHAAAAQLEGRIAELDRAIKAYLKSDGVAR